MTPTRQLSRPEFVALIAILVATIAFSIDAMLPSLPLIASELTPDDPNRAQLIIALFVFGMGVGTLFAGPLSDTFGRKPVITAGLVLYSIGAVLAAYSNSLETLLAARCLQGLGAAAPRVVAQALIRDLYSGRRMAQISSFVMMVFILVPSIAPSIGTLIANGFDAPFAFDGVGWRGVFGAFVLFALLSGLWLNLRQPETLAPENRRRISLRALSAASGEVLTNKLVMIYIAALTFASAALFGLISSIQQIYEETYGLAESFPLWFMAGGLLAGTSTIFNAALVMRMGMRRLANFAFAAQVVIAGTLLILTQVHIFGPVLPFWFFFAWQVSLLGMVGLVFGNLSALALEPMGHIAGMASSVVAAISTVVSVLIAAPIGLAFDGTPRAVLVGALVCSALAWGLMRTARRIDPEPKTTPPGAEHDTTPAH